ncbi:hypothetical protein Thermo_00400 [Thermoplasmatales archaeon]|nr:hypothetical protein Thermo_00400 [Thermoplasmatales archaeon]
MVSITEGKFIDTNIAFDAVYLNRKRHKRTLDFLSDFKSRQVKLSQQVVVEIEEILAESFALLSAKVRDYIKHLEKTKRGWDKLDSGERAKALVDIEKMLSNDKEIIKKNRGTFILTAFNNISNALMTMSFEEIQEDLLHLASDNGQNVMIRIISLFPTVEYKREIDDATDLRKAIEKGTITRFFNENGHGKDKEILSELIMILAFGSKDEFYSEIEFFTCDTDFVEIYGNYRENECTTNDETDPHKLLLTKTLKSLSICAPY